MVAAAIIDRLEVSAYTVPTDEPESDGTLAWDSTTMVLVQAHAGGEVGLGYTYGHPCIGQLIDDKLATEVCGRDAMDVNAAWWAMIDSIRNLGRPGVCSMAIAAVDVALWDLKAKLLQQPLFKLLGAVRPQIEAYGSGGFTSYSLTRLGEQLGDWAEQGFRKVKMKIARHPEQDRARIDAARAAVGEQVELFVDANGAYRRKQALGQTEFLRDRGVTWFEEPVSSEDLDGLRLLRDRAAAEVQISAGEYGYHAPYFRRMLEARAVDVLQADATRCSGISGFLEVVGLCEGFQVPLSTHTAPSIHVQLACAANPVRHIEWFHDHVLIEQRFFDGAPTPQAGRVAPDPARPGLGLQFKHREAQRYAI